jgi:hypothetical protein
MADSNSLSAEYQKVVRARCNKYYKRLVEPCDQLRRLDFNHNQKIREGIESAAKGYLPISREMLKKENPALDLRIG